MVLNLSSFSIAAYFMNLQLGDVSRGAINDHNTAEALLKRILASSLLVGAHDTLQSKGPGDMIPQNCLQSCMSRIQSTEIYNQIFQGARLFFV